MSYSIQLLENQREALIKEEQRIFDTWQGKHDKEVTKALTAISCRLSDLNNSIYTLKNVFI